MESSQLRKSIILVLNRSTEPAGGSPRRSPFFSYFLFCQRHFSAVSIRYCTNLKIIHCTGQKKKKWRTWVQYNFRCEQSFMLSNKKRIFADLCEVKHAPSQKRSASFTRVLLQERLSVVETASSRSSSSDRPPTPGVRKSFSGLRTGCERISFGRYREKRAEQTGYID